MLVACGPAGSVDRVIGGADEGGSDRRRGCIDSRQVLVGTGAPLDLDGDAFGRQIGGDALAIWQEGTALAGRHECDGRGGLSQHRRVPEHGQTQQHNASNRFLDHVTPGPCLIWPALRFRILPY